MSSPYADRQTHDAKRNTPTPDNPHLLGAWHYRFASGIRLQASGVV
jgi:hypothetical protein